MIPRTPVHLRVTIEGSADEVMAMLRRLAIRDGCEVYGTIDAATINEGGRRHYVRSQLPRIEAGEADDALRKLETLARQTLIEPETERKVDETIAFLRQLTATGRP